MRDGLRISDLVEESVELWHQCRDDFLPPGRIYSEREQRDREILLDECLAVIERESRKPPRTRMEREKTHARITNAFSRFASAALDLDDPALELLLRDGFSTIGSDLARKARQFDSSISMTDILQACRNAWTACGLQALFGNPMRLTAAIFAYSLLYPYSDNYLDEPRISESEKFSFSLRFRKRLSGESLDARDAREAAIWRLIEMIENQYLREDYPHVYRCLLAIHQAQHDSIRQLRDSVEPHNIDILRLSCAKGGTSVLADAYLGAGFLDQSEAGFAFAWGVLLQIGDDLQDLYDDLRRGSMTIYSQMVNHGPLDTLTNRTFHFARRVMARVDTFSNSPKALRELLKSSSRSLLVRSAGNAGRFYSPAYLRQLERHSPFRFDFLEQRQERVAQRTRALAVLFEALLSENEHEPVFPRFGLSMSRKPSSNRKPLLSSRLHERGRS